MSFAVTNNDDLCSSLLMNGAKLFMFSIRLGVMSLLIFGINALLLTAHGASVSFRVSSTVHQKYCSDFLFVVKGEITRGDDVRLSQRINELKSRLSDPNCTGSQFSMQLISNGGDVEAALALGRVIRQHEMRVIVPFDTSCLSSCVLVLAGGVDRIVGGKIGIHRPYFESLSDRASIADIRKKREAFLSTIRSYLAEMDVSPTLLDLMLATPPENMRYLALDELESLRLFGKDANYEEREVAKEARFWNLTSADYRKRNSIADRTCPRVIDDFDAGHVCRIQTMLSIPKAEAERRWKRSEKCLDGPDREYVQCLRRYYLNENR